MSDKLIDKRDHSLHASLGKIITALHSLIPPQHSNEWYSSRRFKVGASEIAGFLGRNPNKTTDAGLREKVFTSNVQGSKYLADACCWGTLLEDVIRTHCEFEYKTIIHETGSVYSSPDQAMSPDGIGVIDVINNGAIENRIVLFEYKCPFVRLPTIGKMPDYYVPQVLIGLETLSFCDFAIFVEAVVKRAPLFYDGHKNWYDHGFPICKTKYPEFTTPYCWGAILIVRTNKQLTGNGSEKFKLLLEHASTVKGLLDFGNIEKDYMSIMLESFTEGFLKVHYLYQQHPEEDPIDWYSAKDLLMMAADYENAFGIMRWKMIMKNEITIEGRPLMKLADRYAKVVNDCVRNCDLMDDIPAKELHIKKTTKILESMSLIDGNIVTEPFAVDSSYKLKKKSYVKAI